MLDELARIESIYGCVAEYNRVKWEEENYREPTEEEITESERKMAEYYAEIERLNGEPSEFIKALIAEWKGTEPQYDEWNSEAYYRTRNWAKERCLDIVEKVVDHYEVEIGEDYSAFYRVPKGKFAIKIEYNDSCYIKSLNIGNLSLEQFKKVFRDLHEASLRPTMSHNGQFVSNVSLGHLLRNYIREVEGNE